MLFVNSRYILGMLECKFYLVVADIGFVNKYFCDNFLLFRFQNLYAYCCKNNS